jgi:xylulokinase
MTRSHEVVLGIDSSTQSTKVLAIDLDSGEIVAEARAPHTGADTQDPTDWWSALVTATHVAVNDNLTVRGISVAGQQHGLVTLDPENEPVQSAPLWNNVASAPDAERLNEDADFAAEVGSRLVASITITKVAHLARTSPDTFSRVRSICLPHDYLNLSLTGRLTTDRSEASGSGWWSTISDTDRRDLLALAGGETFANQVRLPTVLGPGEIAGTLSQAAAEELGLPIGIPVGPGAGDNAAAAIGIGASQSELCISLGTSGVAYAVSDRPTQDPTGEVAGFADATGFYLPLTCMLNCTRVVETIAGMFELSIVDALDRVREIAPGANGLLLMPYLSGERTPNLPYANGMSSGLRTANLRPEFWMRAAVDGVAAGLAYCQEALARQDVRRPVVTLVGGGSRHPTWQQAVADATGLPVQVRGGGEHVARGAAIQIAAILREEPVAQLADSWRPDIIAEAEPRPEARDAFRLPERHELIEAMKATAG